MIVGSGTMYRLCSSPMAGSPPKASKVMTQSEDLKRISSDAGLADKDINTLVSNERERYEFYIKAFALAAPPDDRTLLCAVLSDPDHAMGEAAAVEFVGQQAQRHASYGTFVQWAATFSDITSSRGFLSRRIQEWSEFKRIMDGGRVSPDSLADMSDWLQRKLSDEAESSEVLAALIEFGRTRRIRDAAKQHRQTT